MGNFIFTDDVETANTLIMLGYHLIYHQGNQYQFINESGIKINFDDTDNKIKKDKIVYTNKLNF